MERYEVLNVPGKIYPGHAEELVNTKMTMYNDLRNIMAVRPDILDATTVLFAEQSGMLSEILAYVDGFYSPSKASMGKKMGQGSKYANLEKNIKLVGNHEFAWKMRAPQGYVYRFTRDAEAADGGPLGANGDEFYVYGNRKPISSDDVIELADGNTHLMVISENWTGTDWRLRVRLNHEFAGQVVDPYLVSKGVEFGLAYNLKPEASEHGSRVRVPFGAWKKSYMTTMRWEYDVSGTTAHTKTNVQWLVYSNPLTGKMEPYWIPVWDYQMMQAAQKACEHFLWNGKRAVNPDGSPLRDRRGRIYYTGEGAYTQCSKKLRVAYNDLDERHLETMMKTVKLDSLEIVNGTPELVVLGGLQYRIAFDRLMRDTFKAEPSVFFHAKDGEMGVRSNFKMYEAGPLGRVYMLDADFFDSKYMPSLYDDKGDRLQSYRGIVINVSKMIGGQNSMMLVSRAGRQNVIGELRGMSNPASDNSIATTVDAQAKHLLKEIGVAVFNPYCMGEFYKPFKDYRS